MKDYSQTKSHRSTGHKNKNKEINTLKVTYSDSIDNNNPATEISRIDTSEIFIDSKTGYNLSSSRNESNQKLK